MGLMTAIERDDLLQANKQNILTIWVSQLLQN